MTNYSKFPVEFYGEAEQITPVLSKGRCRIFYKYENRNGTYISDEFAEKLIGTLPYTPVKGIYDEQSEDYTDHGEERDMGKIYGIVPENPNFAWETHLDEDGIQRVYACCDVYIFSALYKEADQIVGKSQSMELYAPSIKGGMKNINGQKYFVFEDGCFLGLQVLGNEVEPCFEGAAFFTYYEKLTDLINQMEKYIANSHEKGGTSEMTKFNFKLSDREKFEALWMLLNDKFNEENEYEVSYSIQEVYDSYALAFNYETGSYERIHYVKDDESNVVSITEREPVFVIDVTKDEYDALNALRAYNGGTYNKIDEKINEIDKITEENSEFVAKIDELNNAVSTLTIERDEEKQNYSNAQAQVEELTLKVNELNAFKEGIEKQEKEQVIASYADLLPAEVIEAYTAEKLTGYSVIDLDKELAYELKKHNSEVFTSKPLYVPKDTFKNGIEGILDKYKK